MPDPTNHTDHLRTETILVRTYCGFSATEDEGARESEAPFSSVVLPCRGAFVKRCGGRTVLADANRAVFFRRGEVYATRPAPGARLILEIGVPDGMLGADDTVDDPRREHAPHALTDDSIALRQHRLLRRLRRDLDRNLDPIALEESALRLADRTVARALPADHPSARRVAARTRRAHAELAEATALHLQRHFTESIRLHDVARAVHASAHHLTRVFRAEIGCTMHRYLTRLRLRAALYALADPRVDLTALALDVGFCSHSHFTRAFRAAFGLTPSAVRGEALGVPGAG